jgi:hypothetical protein
MDPGYTLFVDVMTRAPLEARDGVLEVTLRAHEVRVLRVEAR